MSILGITTDFRNLWGVPTTSCNSSRRWLWWRQVMCPKDLCSNARSMRNVALGPLLLWGWESFLDVAERCLMPVSAKENSVSHMCRRSQSTEMVMLPAALLTSDLAGRRNIRSPLQPEELCQRLQLADNAARRSGANEVSNVPHNVQNVVLEHQHQARKAVAAVCQN